MKRQGGFIHFILIIVILVVAGVGFYLWHHHKADNVYVAPFNPKQVPHRAP